MSQRKYTLDFLRLANVLDSKPYATPIDPNVKLNLTNGFPLHDPTLYRTLVGKLIYITITRLDISFVAQTLSQFLKEPRSPYMTALLRFSDILSCVQDKAYFSLQQTISISLHTVIVTGLVAHFQEEAEYRALADNTCEMSLLFP
ncbi:retrovirus-related pol polyprotein from transposon TNT 1-94 [Tanacetum coccineum]